MLLSVITGAVIMLVGLITGWAACNASHGRVAEAPKMEIDRDFLKQIREEN